MMSVRSILTVIRQWFIAYTNPCILFKEIPTSRIVKKCIASTDGLVDTDVAYRFLIPHFLICSKFTNMVMMEARKRVAEKIVRSVSLCIRTITIRIPFTIEYRRTTSFNVATPLYWFSIAGIPYRHTYFAKSLIFSVVVKVAGNNPSHPLSDSTLKRRILLNFAHFL